MTKKRFVVCEPDGSVSWSTKTDGPESFSTFAGAQTRAEELAKHAPGEAIRIYELVAEAVVPTKAVETRRLGK